MRERVVRDVSALQLHGLGTASVSWWGSLAYMLIEGTALVLTIAIYLYLASIAPAWPINAPRPDLWAGTALTVILIASLVPNYFLSRWAKARDLRKVRIGLIVLAISGIVPLVLRFYEFRAFHVSWDSNAYGSIVWLMLGLHTSHVLTDLVETFVLIALMYSRHGDNKRRYGDVQDNALYWGFVVITWLPIYACLYGVPRF